MRGKEAAASANRRADSAVHKVRELELALAEAHRAHREELARVKAQLAQAQGRLATEVRQISEQQINAAHDEAARQISEAREDHRHRVLDGLRFLHDHGVIELRFPDWRTFAAKLGVDVGEIMFDQNRTARRATNRSAKLADDMRRQAKG